MMTNEKKIILLSEILESKVRKEKELEYYTKELYRIQQRIAHLNSDETHHRHDRDRASQRHQRVYAREER